MNTLFPIFLKIETLQTLVIGGGYVGLEKIQALVNNAPNAVITVIAPEIRAEIVALAQKHPIKLIYKQYNKKYLSNTDIVICGTNDNALNQVIYSDCKAKKILINVADTPALCDFYLGAIVQKGDLKIGISTNGKSPTFAKRFREILESILPDTLQETLNNLAQIRENLKGDFTQKVNQLNELTRIMKKQD